MEPGQVNRHAKMLRPLLLAIAPLGRPRHEPQWSGRSRLTLVVAAFLVMGIAALAAPVTGRLGFLWPAPHLADATNQHNVRLGKQVYMERCASCHGRHLQGQPLWQLRDANVHRRAPPLDQAGRAWQHADEELFFMAKHGHFANTARAPTSAMPVFEGVLDDRQIVAVIAFVKASWPIGLRVLQAVRNPDLSGMPGEARNADWTLPPECIHRTKPVTSNILTLD
jgi:mono/diheme cytochrome c family protein